MNAALIITALTLTTGLAACAAEGEAERTATEVALTQDPSADEGATEAGIRDPSTDESTADQEAPPVRQPRRDVQATIDAYLAADPGLSKFFDNAAGYVVFPGIGKAGLGIGGAHGNGELIAKGRGAIGKASMTQVTVGVQIGGQEYSEIIFLAEPVDLERFTSGGLELAAQVSAVAITAGAADGADYKDGVAVFTRTKSGMMAEASVGGQDFKYEKY
jgi:lipid-binding SYLF domain-containing protein